MHSLSTIWKHSSQHVNGIHKKVLKNCTLTAMINGMLNLFVLLYADDTVILPENEHDMQRSLDLLNEYCICNTLKINISITTILVFAKSKTRVRNIRTFKFGKRDLD